MSHYDILEVDQKASATEIKQAFRKKSLQYHPDRNKSSDAHEYMTKITEAYNILGDKDKRRHYDMELKLEKNPFGFFPAGLGMPFMRANTMDDGIPDVNDLFSTLFGGMMHGNMQEDDGQMPNIRIFHGGMPPEHLFGKNPMQNFMKPEPIIKTLDISLEQAYDGCSIPVTIERSIMIGDTKIQEEENIYVDIYPGIDNNEIITLKDKGNVTCEQIKGDVKIYIAIQNNTSFSRNGLDLIFHKTLSLKESLCGFSFDIIHLNKKKLAFNNKSKISIIKPNFKKNIPNMGMKRDGKIGNLIVAFDIVFPDSLSEEHTETLSAIL